MITTGFVCSLVMGVILVCNLITSENLTQVYCALFLIAIQIFTCIGLGLAL